MTAVGEVSLVGSVPTADSTQGCSTLYAKPAWQTDSFCAKRTAIDVAGFGNATAVYLPLSIGSGWTTVQGVTPATAAIGGLYGAANDTINAASKIYATPSGITDVTAGTGAAFGYDLASGVGVPHGLAAL